MTKVYCLNNSGEKVVKKFVLRSEDKNSIISLHSKIMDEMAKVSGELIFEKRISEVAYFMVISFDDYVMQTVWESNIAGIRTEDVIESRVLIIKSDNEEEATETYTKEKRILKEYGVKVLSETKTEGEYRLVLFFTQRHKMSDWELSALGT